MTIYTIESVEELKKKASAIEKNEIKSVYAYRGYGGGRSTNTGEHHIHFITRGKKNFYSVKITRSSGKFHKNFITLDEAVKARDDFLKKAPYVSTVSKRKPSCDFFPGVYPIKTKTSRIVWTARTPSHSQLYYGRSYEKAVAARTKWNEENTRLCITGKKTVNVTTKKGNPAYIKFSNGRYVFAVNGNDVISSKYINPVLKARELFACGLSKAQIRAKLSKHPDRGILHIGKGKWELYNGDKLVGTYQTRQKLTTARTAWENKQGTYIGFKIAGLFYEEPKKDGNDNIRVAGNNKPRGKRYLISGEDETRALEEASLQQSEDYGEDFE